MKPDKLYQELKNLAEKIGIRVSEHNFRITTGIRVRSGFCKVKDQDCCIIDKHLKLNRKMEALAECIHEKSQLSRESIESIYLVPAVRDYMDKFKPIQKKHPKGVNPEVPEPEDEDIEDTKDLKESPQN